MSYNNPEVVSTADALIRKAGRREFLLRTYSPLTRHVRTDHPTLVELCSKDGRRVYAQRWVPKWMADQLKGAVLRRLRERDEREVNEQKEARYKMGLLAIKKLRRRVSKQQAYMLMPTRRRLRRRKRRHA